MEWSYLAELFKVKTRVWVALFVALSLVLFAPISLVDRLGFQEILTDRRAWFGLAWLLTGSVLLVTAISALGPTVMDNLKWHIVYKRRGHARLRNLTPDEKRFLSRYLLYYTRTAYGKLEDGAVRELEANRIIRQASSLSARFTSFAYNIQPWAWDYLTKHPDYVGVTSEEVKKAQEADESSA